jgi:hypothetical protein
MNPEDRVAAMEARWGANDEMVKALREAVTEQGYLDARQSRAIREHSEWLQEHDASIIRAQNEMVTSRREFNERIRILDQRIGDLNQRIADLVSGFGEFIRQQRTI